ncbi:MAG: glycosyltransferase [Crocinitomicaceae bacterium]
MNLNFFTAKFPYTTAEPIVENEFPYLADSFNKIKIFTHSTFSKPVFKRTVPENTEIVDLFDFNEIELTFKYKIQILAFFLVEFVNCPNKRFFIKKAKLWLSYLKIAAKKAKHIEDFNLLLPNSVNYSYWMNDWALVLTFLKRRKTVSNFVFRCGGFDIWDERHPGNYLPFRSLIYRYADQVMPNSKISEEYIKSKTKFKSKVNHKYLGTIDCGMGFTEVDNDILTIVSCSSIIPLKRVELIIEILANVERKIRWVHFGDGKQMNDLKVLIKKKLDKHEVELKGMISNSDIMKFYTENCIDLFITTSSTEGLPVSIQEAISCGIPIIATNVGAMTEVVNEVTGILIEKDFDVREVANLLENWQNSTFNTENRREEIRRFWQLNFDAKQVYPSFISDIKSISNY